jgi:hypothetical protein
MTNLYALATHQTSYLLEILLTDNAMMQERLRQFKRYNLADVPKGVHDWYINEIAIMENKLKINRDIMNVLVA